MNKKLYDLIYEVNNLIEGVWFDSVTGFSKLGDINSNASSRPLQFIAITNTRLGDDDPFEGAGNTPYEAVKDLVYNLKEFKKEANDGE